MAKQVYKELQDNNHQQFEDNPATQGLKNGGSGFKQARGDYEVDPSKIQQQQQVGRGKGRKAPALPSTKEYDPNTIDYDAVKKGMQAMQADNANIGQGGLDHVGLGRLPEDFYDTKIMGINIGTPKKTAHVFNPMSGINDEQEMFRPDKWASTGQSNVSKSINLGTQFVGKTFINTVGGIVGGLYSVGASGAQAVKNRFLDKEDQESALNLLFDNSVNRTLDKGTEWIEDNNTINTHRDGKWASDFFSFNTVKGLSDAGSFIAGAVLSEVIVSTLTAGYGAVPMAAQLASKASKLGKTSKAASFYNNLRKIETLIPEANKLAQITDKSSDAYKAALTAKREIEAISKSMGMPTQDLAKALKANNAVNSSANFLRSTVTGTFWEAGLEARQAKDGFVSEAMRYKQFELDQDVNMTPEEKANALEEYRKEVEDKGENVGNMTFGLNVAVLKASNMIQFPSLFGNKYAKKLSAINGAIGKTEGGVINDITSKGLVRDAATGELRRKSLSELAVNGSWLDRKNFFNKLGGLGKQTGRVAGNSWKYIKNPLTEAAEEYTQYLASQTSQNFYNSVLESANRVDPYVAGDIANFGSALSKSLQDSTKNNAWDEAIIGGIMGAVGIPMFRKGKNGKRQFEMEGGILGDVRAAKAKEAERQDTIDLYNPENWDKSLAQSLQDSVRRSTNIAQLTDLREQAVDEKNKGKITTLRDDMLVNNVIDKLIDGNVDFLGADIQELNNMDLDSTEGLAQFTEKYMNQSEIGDMTEDEMRKYAKDSRKDVVDKMQKTIEAYRKVGPGLQASMKGMNLFDESILKMAVHSVMRNDINTKRIDEITQSLIEKTNGKINKLDIDSMTALEGEFKSAIANTEGLNDIMKTIESLDNMLDLEVGEIIGNPDYKKHSKTLKGARTKLNNLLEKLKLDPTNATLSSKIESAEKSVAKFESIINEFESKANELKDAVDKKKQEHDMLNKQIENVTNQIADLFNEIRESRKDTLDVLTRRDPVTSSSVRNYIKSTGSLNNIVKALSKEPNTADKFKEYLEEDTIEDQLNELVELENERLTSQKIAAFFYNKMGNPNEIADIMYGAHIRSLLEDIQKDLYIANLLMSDPEFDKEKVAAVVANVEASLDKADDWIAKAKEVGVDYLSNKEFSDAYDELISEYNKIANEVGLKIKSNKNVEETKRATVEGERKNKTKDSKDPVDNTDEELPVPGKSKVAASNDGYRTKPNRLLWNLSFKDNQSQTATTLRELAIKGALRTEANVRLDSTLNDNGHETDEWFESLGINKELYTKGRAAILLDTSLIDKAFSTITSDSMDGGSSVFNGKVKIKGTTINVDSTAFSDKLKASKKNNVKSEATVENAQAIVDAHIAHLKNNMDAANRAVAENEGKPNVAEFIAKAKEATTEYGHAQSSMQILLLNGYTNEDLVEEFSELFDGSVKNEAKKIEVSESSLDKASVLIDHYPKLTDIATLNELATMIEESGLEFENPTVATLSDDQSSLFEQVRYYVSNFRVNLGISNETATSSSQGNDVFNGYLPAIKDIKSEEFHKDILDKISIREKELDTLFKDIVKAEENNDTLLVKEYTDRIADLQAEIRTLEEHRTDRSNTEFRKQVLKNGSYNIQLNTVDFGNIPKANLELYNEEGELLAEEDVRDVEEFNVIHESGEGLVKDLDDFIENVIYRTSGKKSTDAKYRDIHGNTVNMKRTETSDVDLQLNDNITTGTYFFIYTDKSGRRVPIKLNKGTVTKDIGSEIVNSMNALFTSSIDVKEFKKAVGRFVTVKQSGKTEHGVLPNSISVKYKLVNEVPTDINVFVTDRDGNSITINEDNFNKEQFKDELMDILLNTRSDVRIGDIVDKDGNIDKKMLQNVLDDNLLNTSLNVENNFDNIYEKDANGEPIVNLSFTPHGYNPYEERTPKKGNSMFLNTIKRMLNMDTTAALTGEEIGKSIKERFLYNAVSLFNKTIVTELANAPKEIVDAYNNYKDYVRFGKTVVSDADIKLVNKFSNSIIIDVISRLTDVDNPKFVKSKHDNLYSNILGLTEIYPMYYTKGSKVSDIHVLNTMLDDINKFKDTLLGVDDTATKAKKALLRYSFFEKSRQSIIKEVESKFEHTRNRKVLEVNTLDKDGNTTLNKDALAEYKNYVELLAEIYRYDDKYGLDIKPLQFKMHTTKNLKGFTETFSGGITYIYSVKESEDGSVKLTAKGVNTNNWMIQYNKEKGKTYHSKTYFYDIGKIDEANSIRNPIIPIFSKEDIDDYKAFLLQGPEERMKLLNYTGLINQKDYEKAIEFLKTKKTVIAENKNTKYKPIVSGTPVEIADGMAKLVDAALDNVLASGGTAIEPELLKKGMPYFKVMQMSTGDNGKITIPFSIYNEIVANQGQNIFDEGGIRLPEYTSEIYEYEEDPVGPYDDPTFSDRHALTFNGKVGKPISLSEFTESEDPLLIALRNIHRLLTYGQEKTPTPKKNTTKEGRPTIKKATKPTVQVDPAEINTDSHSNVYDELIKKNGVDEKSPKIGLPEHKLYKDVIHTLEQLGKEISAVDKKALVYAQFVNSYKNKSVFLTKIKKLLDC